MRPTLLAVLPLLPLTAALAQPCAPRWEGFNLNGEVQALYADRANADAPALYVGGGFTSPAYLARFTGSGFEAVASGLDGDVLAITRHDDGTGPALYVAGFVNVPSDAGWTVCYARLRDGVFRSFGGANGPNTWAGHLASYDFGQGPKLVASGGFGFPCDYVTQWSGAAWECLGPGLASVVNDSRIFDDGSGPELFCAGSFIVNGAAGGGTAGVAKWNGVRWASLGGGLDGYAEVCVVHDDGSGPELVVAGQFSRAGGFPGVRVNNIAKWNGVRWAPLGAGVDRTVTALVPFDDGSGLKLYAAGAFTAAGGLPVQHLARWDGAAWSACPAGGVPAGTINAMIAHDPDGAGPSPSQLFLAGVFSVVGGGSTPAGNFAVLHPTPRPADYNRDGFTDFFDYLAYAEAFEAGAADADYNHDGFLDFFDYSDFVAAFERGC